MQAARVILQEALDDLGSALITGDWDGFLARIDLPFEMQTDTATIHVTRADDMRDGYDRFREFIFLRRVTDYVRLAETAAFDGPDTLSGSYVSHLLSNGTWVVPPYRSLMVLRRRDSDWFACRIVANLQNDRWPILTPHPSEKGA
jgi:hypothetical protein